LLAEAVTYIFTQHGPTRRHQEYAIAMLRQLGAQPVTTSKVLWSPNFMEGLYL
jgi:hypothetical protein